MSPQTHSTIKREARTLPAMARPRARVSTVLRHEMTVIAADVADVVASAGGWLYDRRMAGWCVNVMVSDRDGGRALEILGAEVFDLDGNLDAVIRDPERAHATVVVAAHVYARDGRVRQFVSDFGRGGAEVALWGEAEPLGLDVSAAGYRMSAAARAFKAQALLALGLPNDAVAPTEAVLHCGVTALPPVALRS